MLLIIDYGPLVAAHYHKWGCAMCISWSLDKRWQTVFIPWSGDECRCIRFHRRCQVKRSSNGSGICRPSCVNLLVYLVGRNKGCQRHCKRYTRSLSLNDNRYLFDERCNFKHKIPNFAQNINGVFELKDHTLFKTLGFFLEFHLKYKINHRIKNLL